jgi:hypothetical protein
MLPKEFLVGGAMRIRLTHRIDLNLVRPNFFRFRPYLAFSAILLLLLLADFGGGAVGAQEECHRNVYAANQLRTQTYTAQVVHADGTKQTIEVTKAWRGPGGHVYQNQALREIKDQLPKDSKIVGGLELRNLE